MMARRDGIQGEKVPPGILTYHRGLAHRRTREEV
jgi:hypothetical protein